MKKEYRAIVKDNARAFVFSFRSYHRLNRAAVRKDCKAALISKFGAAAVGYKVISI